MHASHKNTQILAKPPSSAHSLCSWGGFCCFFEGAAASTHTATDDFGVNCEMTTYPTSLRKGQRRVFGWLLLHNTYWTGAGISLIT